MPAKNSVLEPGWPVFIFLILATLPNTFTTTLLAPGLPILASHLGHGADGVARAQMLMTIPGIAMLITPFIGWIADRWGKRPVLLAALASDTIAGISCIFVDDFGMLLVLRFILGLGVGALMAVSLSMVGDYYSGDARTRMLGYRWAAMTLFSLGAVQAAGLLAKGYGWTAPMWLYLVGLPLFVYAAFKVKPKAMLPDVQPDTSPQGETERLRATLNRVFLAAMAGNILLAVVTYNLYAQLPFLMREKGYLDPRYFSAIMIPVSIASIGMSLAFIRLRKRLNPLAIIAIALLAFAAGTVLFAQTDRWPCLVLAAILTGGPIVMFEPALSSYLFDRIHPSRRALAMGSIFGTFHVGPFLIPVIFGPINSAYGFSTSFLVLAAAALLGALVLLVGLRWRITTPAMGLAPA